METRSAVSNPYTLTVNQNYSVSASIKEDYYTCRLLFEKYGFSATSATYEDDQEEFTAITGYTITRLSKVNELNQQLMMIYNDIHIAVPTTITISLYNEPRNITSNCIGYDIYEYGRGIDVSVDENAILAVCPKTGKEWVQVKMKFNY